MYSQSLSDKSLNISFKNKELDKIYQEIEDDLLNSPALSKASTNRAYHAILDFTLTVLKQFEQGLINPLDENDFVQIKQDKLNDLSQLFFYDKTQKNLNYNIVNSWLNKLTDRLSEDLLEVVSPSPVKQNINKTCTFTTTQSVQSIFFECTEKNPQGKKSSVIPIPSSKTHDC